MEASRGILPSPSWGLSGNMIDDDADINKKAIIKRVRRVYHSSGDDYNLEGLISWIDEEKDLDGITEQAEQLAKKYFPEWFW